MPRQNRFFALFSHGNLCTRTRHTLGTERYTRFIGHLTMSSYLAAHVGMKLPLGKCLLLTPKKTLGLRLFSAFARFVSTALTRSLIFALLPKSCKRRSPSFSVYHASEHHHRY